MTKQRGSIVPLTMADMPPNVWRWLKEHEQLEKAQVEKLQIEAGHYPILWDVTYWLFGGHCRVHGFTLEELTIVRE